MRGLAPFRRFVPARYACALAFVLAAALATTLLALTPATACGGSPMTTTTASSAAAPLRFVAFGDSLTAGYKTPGPSWPSRLTSMRSDIKLVHNAGVTGDTTKDLLARMERDVYAYSPDLLTIFVGLNDLSRCGKVSQVFANIRAMVAGARAHGIPRVVLILNSHTISYSGRNGHSCGPALQGKIDQLDDALIAYGIAAGVQTIDLRPVMDTDGHYTKAFLVADGVHYNDRGVATVAAAIDAQLSAGYNRYLRGPR